VQQPTATPLAGPAANPVLVVVVFAITQLPSTSTAVVADPIRWPTLLLALPAALLVLGLRRFARPVRI
jgi:hypothetical protein